MQRLVELECADGRPSPFRILEIGSWAGGSAITWADAIKRFNGGEGLVVCVDPWIQYIERDDYEGVYAEMREALDAGGVFGLFQHNIRACGHDDLIRMMRGSSVEILPLLKPEAFDLVFIDGDHSYHQVLGDLVNAAPLVRDGGVLSGDDLELQLHQVDWENCIQESDSDFVLDPRSNQRFHPGVTRAVAEVIGEVSAWEGFWAMRKEGSGWKSLPVTDLGPTIEIPKHLVPVSDSVTPESSEANEPGGGRTR
jgi:predicted O-methyltransferase YrrM